MRLADPGVVGEVVIASEPKYDVGFAGLGEASPSPGLGEANGIGGGMDRLEEIVGASVVGV